MPAESDPGVFFGEESMRTGDLCKRSVVTATVEMPLTQLSKLSGLKGIS